MIPLVKELRGLSGVENAVFLTYSLNLAWFERLILARLRAKGLRSALVLADADQLSKYVEVDAGALVGAGRSYVVQGIARYPSFHPKALLLSGPKTAHLYVGSGNLNRRGLSTNLEIYESWEATARDAAVPSAFGAFQSFLYKLLEDERLAPGPVTGALRQVADEVFASPVFNKGRRDETGGTLAGSPGSLWTQLGEDLRGSDAVVVVAPFFDKHGRFAVELGATARAGFQVVTDMRTTNVTPAAVQAIRGAGGEVHVLDETEEERRLHAKVMVARGRSAVAVTGSANCTNAAWHGHNCELVSIRRGEAAEVVWDLVRALRTRPLSDEDLATLAARADEADQEDDDGLPENHPVLTSARWRSGGLIEFSFRFRGLSPSGAVLLGRREQVAAIELGSNEDPDQCVGTLRVPDGFRGVAVVVQLVTEGWRGNAVVVQDLVEIREHATGRMPAEDLLEQLLDGARDVESAERLLTLLTNIAEESRPDSSAKASAASSTKKESQTKFLVSEEDYEGGGELGHGDSGRRASRALGPVGAHLINRLLFGEQAGDEVDDAEGESETDEDSVPDARESPSRRASRRRPKASLLKAAEKARNAYIQAFQRTTEGRAAWRLNRDLQVLLASLHYLLRNGMSPLEFAGHVVPLLRAFLGHAHAPLPKALAALEGEERQEAWVRFQFLLNAALLVYNAALANAEAKGTDREDVFEDLPLSKPVLWLRHVVEHAPDEAVSNLLDNIDSRMPALRRGAFWVADLLPRAGDIVTFPVFLRRMVADALALNAASVHLREHVRKARTAVGIDDADLVVGLEGGDHLVSGFAEEGAGGRWAGMMYQQAFVSANPGAVEVAMKRCDPSQLVPIEELEAMAIEGGDLVCAGVDVLRRLAST